jgi:hypothetical protein
VTTTIHHHYDEWYGYPYKRTFWSPPFGGPYYGSLTSTAADDKLGSSEVKAKGMSPLRSAANSVSSTAGDGAQFSSNAAFTNAVPQNSATMDSYVAEVGITVPGSKVQQSFTTVYGFKSEVQSHVIIIRLAGKIGTVEIAAPVTVKTKNICSTCSHTNKHTARFCSACGTSLTLL